MKLEILIVCFLQAILVLSIPPTFAENIDPDNDGNRYAYGENIGWLNFEPNQGPGVTVSDNKLTGFIWAENIGWINLDPDIADPNAGIKNDGTGLLSGFAWGENVGWLNFDPNVPGDSNHYGVTIDSDGNFDGWAWGENIGWIHFRSAYMVNFERFANFAVEWLETGTALAADLYEDGNVNWHDLGVFTDYWLDECPTDWGVCPPSYQVKTSWTTPM